MSVPYCARTHREDVEIYFNARSKFRVTEVIEFHPLGTMNFCTKFCLIPSKVICLNK